MGPLHVSDDDLVSRLTAAAHPRLRGPAPHDKAVAGMGPCVPARRASPLVLFAGAPPKYRVPCRRLIRVPPEKASTLPAMRLRRGGSVGRARSWSKSHTATIPQTARGRQGFGGNFLGPELTAPRAPAIVARNIGHGSTEATAPRTCARIGSGEEIARLRERLRGVTQDLPDSAGSG